MNLHSPAFEKALRNGVKKAVRESRELKKEYRQARKARARALPWWAGRIFLGAFLGISVFSVTAASHHTAMGLEFITLWAFAWIFYHAWGLWRLLFSQQDLIALRMLPVESPVMFDWLFQRFYPKALLSVFDLIAGFTPLCLMLKFSTAQWLGTLLIIAGTWLLLMALALLCCVRVPPSMIRRISGGLTFLAFILVFGAKIEDGAMLVLLDHAARDLNIVIPTGWMVSQFQLLLSKPDWAVLFLLVPAAAAILTLKNSLNRLRYIFQQVAENLMADFQPALRIESQSDPDSQSHEGLTTIEEQVQTRQFLTVPEWPGRGGIETLLWNWLTPREKALAEFIFPAGYSITKPWLKVLRNFLLGVAAAFAVGMIAPAFRTWSFVIVLFFTGLPALAYNSITGSAFAMLNSSGVNIPVYAMFGIGYREMSRLLVKCSLVQLPMLVPFVTACGVIISWLCGLPWTAGIVPGLKAGVLIFSTRYIFMLLAFSGGTNDSSRLRMRTVLLFALIMGFGLLFLGLGAVGIFVYHGNARDGLIGWGLCVLAVLDAWFLFRIYGWFYNMNLFDLMKAPR